MENFHLEQHWQKNASLVTNEGVGISYLIIVEMVMI